MKNLGEGDMKGVSEDGVAIEFTAQVGEGVKKMLLSVKSMQKWEYDHIWSGHESNQRIGKNGQH